MISIAPRPARFAMATHEGVVPFHPIAPSPPVLLPPGFTAMGMIGVCGSNVPTATVGEPCASGGLLLFALLAAAICALNPGGSESLRLA